jgi:hypothetical protein
LRLSHMRTSVYLNLSLLEENMHLACKVQERGGGRGLRENCNIAAISDFSKQFQLSG